MSGESRNALRRRRPMARLLGLYIVFGAMTAKLNLE